MPDGGDGPRLPNWARHLLRLCLLSWPGPRRRREGAALLKAAESLLSDAFRRGPAAGFTETMLEGWGLVAAGTGLRLDALQRATSGATGGISGDLRFALRTLRRNPAFTAVSLVTLALALGANAAVFSMVDRVLLRPPTYEAPEELVLVWNRLPDSAERVPVAGPDVAILQARSRTLSEVGFATRARNGAVDTSSGAEHVRIASVGPGFFRTLGVAPALGRGFASDDTGDVVLVSHGAWLRLFAGDPGSVGRTILLDGSEAVVVGVMPRGFRVEAPPDAGVRTDVDVWRPLGVPLDALHREEDRLLDQDSDNTGLVVARLAPGASLAEARAEAADLAARLRADVPAYGEAGLDFLVRRLRDDVTRHARGVLLALSGGVLVVLLVACLNLGILLLARGLARRREWSVRMAVGAGAGRLARQVAVEGLVLAAGGTAGALVIMWMTMIWLQGVVPPGLSPPEGLEPRASETVLVLVLGAAVAGLLAVIPAVQALKVARAGRPRAGVRSGFRGAARIGRPPAGHGSGSRGAIRSRRTMVVAEVALSVVLVLGAGLLFRTVAALRDVDPGFEARGALTFRTSIRLPDRYRGPAERAALVRNVERALAELPGVAAVGSAGALPLSGDRWSQPWGLPGQAPSEWEANRAEFRVITSGWFEALGTRLLEGRTFTAAEDLGEDERVVVIDRSLARTLAPNGSALGMALGLPLDGRPVEARVVGVVEPIRHAALEREGHEAIYVPYRQEASREVAFVVRTSGDPGMLARPVREAVRSVDPDLPLYEMRSLRDYVDQALAPRTFTLRLLGAFAGLGLLCAAVGLYGVVAFDVRRSTRDLGLRMAVGATRGRILGLVLANGLKLAIWGGVAGAALGAVVVRIFQGLLHQVGPADPISWGITLGLVALVTLAACAVPAFRAARLDPSEALRAE